ncbi:MAG: hypothetical protein AB7J35_21055 [Dehalococcoidia bacterium]
MSGGEKVWVGADPGGAKNFGLCLLTGSEVRTWCVNCADEAVELVLKHSAGTPAGVGVDAPMWWSSGRSSDRMADQWIRKTYKLSGGEVQSVNSLRGAALAQGMLFVELLRRSFPDIPVTESHPNAVLRAVGMVWSAFCASMNVPEACNTKHERDAIIAAVSAREGFEGRWARDLSENRHPSEQDPSRYWLGPVHYFWPGDA